MKELREPCWEGWDDKEHNKRGECCCNCEWHRPVNAHPWNNEPVFKGPISNQIGWCCICPEFYPHVTISDREHDHGLCECHQERDYTRLDKMAEQDKERVWHILTA